MKGLAIAVKFGLVSITAPKLAVNVSSEWATKCHE